MYSGHLWISKRHIIKSVGMVCGRCYECMELGGKLFRVCVLVGNDVSEWFPINVGLRQGCVMSPCCLVYIWMVWFER